MKREKCGGPGGKEIFATRAEAVADLKMKRRTRAANSKTGGVQLCAWGNHYHISKSRGRG